jgi:hypothetical protein
MAKVPAMPMLSDFPSVHNIRLIFFSGTGFVGVPLAG